MNRSTRLMATMTMVLSVTACSGSSAPATTTTAAPSTTTSSTTTTTSTTTSTTTIPIAPPPTDVQLTVPSTLPAPRRTGYGPCEDPSGAEYCIWGTPPVPLTVINSRKAEFAGWLRQGFTPVHKKISNVTLLLESKTVGALTVATEETTREQVCLRVTLMSDMGLPIATTALVTASTKGVKQQIKVPMTSAVVPGALHKLMIEKGPACTTNDLSTYVAMSSNFKYPRAYGKLAVDGKVSEGSLWARID